MIKPPVILFRSERNTLPELEVAAKYFEVVDSRVGIRDRLVIGRYSVLPYFRELEKDLKLQGSTLINPYFDHSYIANFDYYFDIKHLTAESWFELRDVPKDGGPFVVKGRTNSRKFDWDTMMFAPDYLAAVRISSELSKDPLIGPQGLVFRRFLPLKVLEVGISGTPFSNEWRFFFYKTNLLSHGFYWSSSEMRGEMNAAGLSLAQEAASIISERVDFFVLDIAEDVNGKWWVIEVNDGQMSGLSENDPEVLYSNLSRVLKANPK